MFPPFPPTNQATHETSQSSASQNQRHRRLRAAIRYPYLIRYDVEVSGFGSHVSGHLNLLRLKEQIPPGGDSKEHWPTLGRVYVRVDDKPIRASRQSAQWCLQSVEQCWKAKAHTYRADERATAAADYETARSMFRGIIEASP